jgi:hypothetical protein
MKRKIKDIVIFKGKKAKSGPVHTRNIVLDDIREIFFPKDFNEKYGYLGSVPWNEEGDIFKAMEPLVIFMDHKAKPWWCPRWFLRLLHLFGSDKSIVRVRNFKLHNLSRKITKGYMIIDYKTKWTWYDLRISIAGNDQCWNLSHAIEHDFYNKGLAEDLRDELKDLNPSGDYKGWSVRMLKDEIKKYDKEEIMKEEAKDQLIEILENQVVDLSMMSKIELGDDVIAEIKRLKAIING